MLPADSLKTESLITKCESTKKCATLVSSGVEKYIVTEAKGVLDSVACYKILIVNDI